MHYTFIIYKVNNNVSDILYVDWFLLSKLFLKRFLSSLLLREYDEFTTLRRPSRILRVT